MLRIRNSQDLSAGLFLILVAVLALVFSGNLPTGRLVDMGPGYVPRTLAWLLGGLGVIVAARGFTTDAPADASAMTAWGWRPLLALTASLLVFAFLLERVGLLFCVLITVVVAGFAVKGIGLIQSLMVAIVLAAASVILFVVGLGLPLPPWPDFGG